jgi:hypothetical protein
MLLKKLPESVKVLLIFDGKSDGIAVFKAKSPLSKFIYRRSTTYKMNCSLTIEWE